MNLIQISNPSAAPENFIVQKTATDETPTLYTVEPGSLISVTGFAIKRPEQTTFEEIAGPSLVTAHGVVALHPASQIWLLLGALAGYAFVRSCGKYA